MAETLDKKAQKQVKEQAKEQEKIKKAEMKAEQNLLKQQDKVAKAEKKAEAKADKQLAKVEAKDTKKTKAKEEKLRQERVKIVLSRSKIERKPAKLAAKAIAQERNRPLAYRKIQSVRKNFMDLPPVLWPLMLVVSYIWAKNAWEKERQTRDLKEARRFLKETRDIR